MLTPQNPAESPRKLKILLTEDNLVNRVLAQKLLQKNGHTVTLANNGKEATTHWEKNHSNQFDVLLMDIQMPVMDGLQATSYIRARERILQTESSLPPDAKIHVPIIAMTAHAMKGDRERYMAGGMDGYVSKPINSTELEQVLQSVVGGPSPRIFSPQQFTGTAEESNSAKSEDAEIRERFGRDANLMGELAEIFALECPQHLSGLQAAIRDKDAKALEHSAHTLKGCVANFSSSGAFQSALKLEMLGRSGDLADAPEILNILEVQLLQLNEILSGMARNAVRAST
jgi:two-component system sensor histidine kinase/response regulator